MHLPVLSGRTLIVLGKGLDGFPKKGEKVTLNVHSELNVRAAGILYRREKVQFVVFTGGPTKGKQYISEAQAMKEKLFALYPTIPYHAVLVEKESLDTRRNIKKMIELNYIRPNTTIPVLSIEQHLERASVLFKNIANIEIEPIAAQQVIWEYGDSNDKKLLEHFILSGLAAKEEKKEQTLRKIVKVDPKGILLGFVANFTRR